ncbi:MULTISPECIES: hypothetical protein [unclassified Microcoleus]|uniref:hypothetical protein n=2 Tax=unclassified Microcoleus TaxID=2642155 RepID=UPI0025F08A44|nr:MULTISPECIES: hypothetical protein [unclassified Microcoleus]
MTEYKCFDNINLVIFVKFCEPMKLNSSLFCKAVLVTNLLLASVTTFGIVAQAQTSSSTKNYKGVCSFYGQNQRQAQTIGCSVKQSLTQITITWEDGFITNVVSSEDGVWQSMPSRSLAGVTFYAGSGQVSRVEIYEGPGKGILVVNPL